LSYANNKTATGTINATYYFVKAFPLITVQSTATKNQITLRITNGNDSPITLSGLELKGSSATIDGQDISGVNSGSQSLVTLTNKKSLARGESVDVVIRAEASGNV
jgi:hypothetical protein